MSSEQSYYDQIRELRKPYRDDIYDEGYNDAVDECQSIAAEADATIADQAAEIERLREVVDEVTAERDERDEAVKAKVLEIAGKDARIRDLEDNDAIGRRLTDGHLARIVELEKAIADEQRWNIRRKDVWDRIGVALAPFREKRSTGEPSRNDADEVEALCARIAELEAVVGKLKGVCDAEAD